MADELKIEPLGEQPENGSQPIASDDSVGDYKFDSSGTAGETNGNIDLSAGKNEIPGLIGASTSADQQKGALVEEPPAEEPPAEEPPAEEPPAEEPPAEEPPAEEPPAEEPPAEEPPAEEPLKKKGIPKAILLVGALMLAMLLGAGAYYGLGGYFKGELAVPSTDLIMPAAEEPATTETCPVDEYYDPYVSTVAVPQNLQTNRKTEFSIGADFNDPVVKLAARDYGRAQLMQLNDSSLQMMETSDPTITSTDLLLTEETTEDSELEFTYQPAEQELTIHSESLDTTYETTEETELEFTYQPAEQELTIHSESLDTTYETTEETELEFTYQPAEQELTIVQDEPTAQFDPSMCNPIPQDNCELLANLQENPDAYYLHPDTVDKLDRWIEQCSAAEELVLRDSTDFLYSPVREIAPTTEICGTNQTLQRDGTCECSANYFDISSAKTEPESTLMMIDVIEEPATLECVNCEELNEIIFRKKQELENPQRGTDTNALQSEIENLEAIAREQGCVEEVREEVALPLEEPSLCDQYSTNAMTLLERGDVRGSFDAVVEYIKSDCGRTYSDCEEYLAIAKVSKEYAVIAAEKSPPNVSFFESNYERNRNEFFANPLCVNTTDLCVELSGQEETAEREFTDRIDSPSVELLSYERMLDSTSTDILMIDSYESEELTMEKLQKDMDYYISVNGIEDEKERDDFIDLYCPLEEPAPVREEPLRDVIPMTEEPLRDVIPMTEEPAPVREEPEGEVAAPPPAPEEIKDEPSAMASAIVDEPTLIVIDSPLPPVDSTVVPPQESAALEKDTIVASTAAPQPESTLETIETAPELRPAAPTITPVDPSKPAPLITAETAPPDIYPVGPEVVMYAFALIASQLYFFRRRILEFVMNK